MTIGVRSTAVAALLVFCSPHASSLAQTPEAIVKEFDVIAKRFVFEPSTIEVTEGDRVKLLVRSGDGLHGVEIKEFKVKKAVPRPKPNDEAVVIEFVASQAGTFPILCSEYCGNGHKEMTGTLVVQAKPKQP